MRWDSRMLTDEFPELDVTVFKPCKLHELERVVIADPTLDLDDSVTVIPCFSLNEPDVIKSDTRDVYAVLMQSQQADSRGGCQSSNILFIRLFARIRHFICLRGFNVFDNVSEIR